MKQAAFAYIEVLIQVHVQLQSPVQCPVSSFQCLCVCVCESVALWHATNCVWLPHRRRANIDFVSLIWYFRFRCLRKLQYCLALDLIQFLIIRSAQPETAVAAEGNKMADQAKLTLSLLDFAGFLFGKYKLEEKNLYILIMLRMGLPFKLPSRNSLNN